MKSRLQLLNASEEKRAGAIAKTAVFFALLVKVILPIVNGVQAVVALLQIARLF